MRGKTAYQNLYPYLSLRGILTVWFGVGLLVSCVFVGRACCSCCGLVVLLEAMEDWKLLLED